jgi:hypothetical protein
MKKINVKKMEFWILKFKIIIIIMKNYQYFILIFILNMIYQFL